MKTAHPASLPPGPRSSRGISRSTVASTSDASSDVKNCQGPGRTGTGGVAVPGRHGMPPLTVRASPEVVLVKKIAALDASNERRDILTGEKASIIAMFRIPAFGRRTDPYTVRPVNFLFEIAPLNR